VVFDEAQRVWDARQLASFMKRKKGRPGFTQSESELLLSALDRHDDWAVVVCLVGGGQEINTGEAGIGAWLESVRTAFPGWDVFISGGKKVSGVLSAKHPGRRRRPGPCRLWRPGNDS